MNYTPDTTRIILNNLATHTGKWPTNSELRATHDNTTPTYAKNSRNPYALPFGLDKTTDTIEHTKTYQGATQLLESIRNTWTQHAGEAVNIPHGQDRYENAIRALIHLNQRAYETLPQDTYQETVNQLATLAHQAEEQCATGLDSSGLECHTCRTPLGHAYTEEGLDPNLYCPACDRTWTPTEYAQYARARIIYGHAGDNTNVTVSEAAALLNMTVAGVMLRVKRRQVIPICGHGRGAVYRLSDLR